MLEFAASGILGSIFGGLFRLAPEVLKFWDRKDDRKHELALYGLQIDLETGVGLNLGQGSDPEVMLRWSDDGGHTWSNYHTSPVGKIGQYYHRTFFRRLGMTLKLRDRVYELSMTDPVKTAIMGAELIISPTNA